MTCSVLMPCMMPKEPAGLPSSSHVSCPAPAGYKAYSHNKALKGCRQLLASIQSSGGAPSTAGSAGAPAPAAAAYAASTAEESHHSAARSSPDTADEASSTAGTSRKSQQPALIHLMSNEELARIVQIHQGCVMDALHSDATCARAIVTLHH